MQNNLFHAYVIGGPRATARGHIATLLAPFAVCTPGNPDYVVSEYVSFGVEEAEMVRDWQRLSPHGERKVCVIYTDFITPAAQNALLKTLEEPVPNTHIVLAVSKPDVLLGTLLSRVVVEIPERIQDRDMADMTGMADGTAFLKMSPGERIASVAKLAAKSEDEDAAAEVREKTIAFIESLETVYAKKLQQSDGDEQKKLIANIEQILLYKKYLHSPGASVKMILETIALTQ